MQNPITSDADKKVYYSDPNFCMDCKLLLPYIIKANKRCVPCYDIERSKKDEYESKD